MLLMVLRFFVFAIVALVFASCGGTSNSADSGFVDAVATEDAFQGQDDGDSDAVSLDADSQGEIVDGVVSDIGSEGDTVEQKDGDDVEDFNDASDVSSPVVGFVKGPYLQDVKADSVLLLIQTSAAPLGQVVVRMHPVAAPDDVLEIPLETGGTELVTAPPIDGWIGRARLDSLAPQTAYEYCVALPDEERCGSFVTATIARTDAPFTFVAFGDTRTNVADHAAVVSAILDENPPAAFVIHTGDLEAIGADLTFWQQFFDVEAMLLLNAPFYAVPGNHENILWGLEYFEAFFELPDDEMSYTFEYGNAAFLMLNTEEDLLVPETLAWIRSELERLANTGSHVFVVTHHPLITFSNHSPYNGGDGLKILGPDFTKAHVAAVFSGHNHCYEHFLVEGVHYFTLGGGGAPLYGVDSNVIPELEGTRVHAAKVHHHMVVSVNGPKVTMVVKDDDNHQAVMDTIVVGRPPRD